MHFRLQNLDSHNFIKCHCLEQVSNQLDFFKDSIFLLFKAAAESVSKSLIYQEATL
jgi:hypothetical protein